MVLSNALPNAHDTVSTAETTGEVVEWLARTLAPISHTPERKDEQGVMPGFDNREAANMKLHIDNERFDRAKAIGWQV